MTMILFMGVGNLPSFVKSMVILRGSSLSFVLEYSWRDNEWQRGKIFEERRRLQAELTQNSMRALQQQEDSLSNSVMGGFPDDGWSERYPYTMH